MESRSRLRIRVHEEWLTLCTFVFFVVSVFSLTTRVTKDYQAELLPLYTRSPAAAAKVYLRNLKVPTPGNTLDLRF